MKSVHLGSDRTLWEVLGELQTNYNVLEAKIDALSVLLNEVRLLIIDTSCGSDCEEDNTSFCS